MPMGVKVTIHEEEDDDAQVSSLQNTNTADQTPCRSSAGDQSTAQGTTENSRDQQHAQIEEATKKVDEFAFMMNKQLKQKHKNVLCPATVHGHGVIYLSLNF